MVELPQAKPFTWILAGGLCTNQNWLCQKSCPTSLFLFQRKDLRPCSSCITSKEPAELGVQRGLTETCYNSVVTICQGFSAVGFLICCVLHDRDETTADNLMIEGIRGTCRVVSSISEHSILGLARSHHPDLLHWRLLLQPRTSEDLLVEEKNQQTHPSLL